MAGLQPQLDVDQEAAWFAHLLTTPLFFSGLVVENTTRCNAKCAMCYQSVGPKGSDTWGKAGLSVEDIAPVILEAAQLEVVYPRFHLSGGESFLNLQNCYDLFEIAKVSGFLEITTTTNAYWARKRDKAQAVATRLRSVGVTNIEISWDYWHLPFIPAEAITNCLDACREADIETNLRVLSTRSHSYHEALALLNPKSLHNASRITCGPVFATGRAAKEIKETEFHGHEDLTGSCHTFLNLTVNALGNVFPCCAGFDQTDNYLFGNVRDQSIIDIVESMNSSPLLRTLVIGGVKELASILNSGGISLDGNYQSICHMCWSIFSSPERVAQIEGYFDALQKDVLQQGLLALENSEIG